MEKDPQLVSLMEYDGLVSRSFFNDIRPSRKARVESYMSGMNIYDQENASQMAAEIKKPELPLARTIVLIPVAAHQEAHNISNAVDQYAKQVVDEPFSVILFPNAPFEEQGASEKTMHEISQASLRHPELDLRWHDVEFHEEAVIGDIRRRLWNAALLLSYTEGAFENEAELDVLGLNHDIDVVSMSPRYLQRVRDHYTARQRRLSHHGITVTDLPVRSTEMSQAYDTHCPNSSQATFWSDFSLRQRKVSYEASLVIPFSRYVQAEGFSADARTYETGRVAAGLGTSLWSEDSFGDRDECRNPGSGRDITQARKEDVIFETLEDQAMPLIFDRAYSSAVEKEFAAEHALRSSTMTTDERRAALAKDLQARKNLAVHVLRRFVDAPTIASIVEDTYDPGAMAEQYLPRANVIL